MLMSLVECGVPINEAREMSFSEAVTLLSARNETHAPSEGAASGGAVRAASQSDIKRVFG